MENNLSSILKPISEAPKDGTEIIIVWNEPYHDYNNFQIRNARWWKPTQLSQWESGGRPHWAYSNDRDMSMSIDENKIIGWCYK